MTAVQPAAAATRGAASAPYVLDGDVHVHEPPAELAEYADAPWDVSLRQLDTVPERYLDLPGMSPNAIFTPPFPGDTDRSMKVGSAAEMRAGLDELGVDEAVLLPDHLLSLPKVQGPDYAAALARAYNRWLHERWLVGAPSFHGGIAIAPQDPAVAAEEVRRHGADARWCCVYLPTCAVRPLYGHRSYDAIYAAAVEHDLPVLLHGATTVHPTFPFQLDVFESWMGQHCFAHPLSIMCNLVSMLETGVFERFPRLRIGVMEAGISWVWFLMTRLDKEWMEVRRQMPYLREPPSHYLQRVFYGTQPIEEPADPGDLVKLMDFIGGRKQVVFASDWPHHDFDHPRHVMRLPFDDELRRDVMGRNAQRLFRLAGSR